MNLSELQSRLIELTESEEFVNLETFRDEFHSIALKEFEQYFSFKEDSYSSTTLFRTDKYEIRLLCWKPLQETPRHPHPENGCLMKILQGKLIENKFTGDTTIETNYNKGDVGYIKAAESHILKNAEADSVSLHIYSPSGFYNTLNNQ